MTLATFLFSHGLAEKGLEVRCPADDTLLAVVRSHTPSDVEAAVPRVEAAGREWAARTAKERATVLRTASMNILSESMS